MIDKAEKQGIDRIDLRAALEAAASAFKETVGPVDAENVSTAVAAFLRALPGVIVFEVLEDGRSRGMGDAADLARCVEQAGG